MRHAILGAGLWAALILPVGGAQNTKKKADYQATQADYDALVQAQVAAGKVSALASTDKTFTLQLEYQYLVSTGKRGSKVNSQVTSLLRQQEQIMAVRDPVKRLQRLEKLIRKAQQLKARGGRLPFKVKQGRKDFDLRAIEDVKVRVMQPPVEYDDQGNVKKYTAKELKELKGKDRTLPGYTANWDQVADSQTVTVYLKPRTKKPAKDKDKDKDTNEVEDDYRPLVKVVVILAEADDNKPKKKGKEK
jgi:hypothetical protein